MVCSDDDGWYLSINDLGLVQGAGEVSRFWSDRLATSPARCTILYTSKNVKIDTIANMRHHVFSTKNR